MFDRKVRSSNRSRSPFAANSAITLFIDAAGDVKLGYKLTGNGNAEDANNLLTSNVSANGTVTGFHQILSNTAYNLTLNETGGTSNFFGNISGLTANAWIPGAIGNSALALEALRNNATSDLFKLDIDQLAIVPEPTSTALFITALITVIGLAIFLRRKIR